MSSIPPEVLQLLSGLAGAFVAGGIFVWRARARLPLLINDLIAAGASAMRQIVRDELEELLDDKLKGPLQRLTKLEQVVKRHADAGTELERQVNALRLERRTGT